MTPAVIDPPQSVASAVEVNETVRGETNVAAAQTRVIIGAGDLTSLIETDASDERDAFPEHQRTFEPGIDYERWTAGIDRAPREDFADTLDFVEYLDD